MSDKSQGQSPTDKPTFEANRDAGGTREWSDASHNIALGCDHDCLYCYARRIAQRFGLIETFEKWTTMEVNQAKVNASARNFGGVVMFPTTHDITPEILPAALETLKKLLAAGNEVLIVSKPHLEVIQTLCRELGSHRDKILFRFTIGSLSASTCKLWERGAPPPSERIAALKFAFKKNFRTSVSMEPMLGQNDEMQALVARVSPLVTDTIWLGKLNGGIPMAAQALPGVKSSLAAIRGGGHAVRRGAAGIARQPDQSLADRRAVLAETRAEIRGGREDVRALRTRSGKERRSPGGWRKADRRRGGRRREEKNLHLCEQPAGGKCAGDHRGDAGCGGLMNSVPRNC